MSGWLLGLVMAGVGILLVGAACAVVLVRMERSLARREAKLEEQVATLDQAVRLIEARLEETAAQPAPSGAAEMDANGAAGEEGANGETIDADVAPEIQAAIAAAAVVAAGPGARLRSVQLVKAREGASAWSQQGRVLVQSSHNLNPAGRP